MSGWTEVRLGNGLRVHHGFAFKGEFFSPTGTQIVLTPGNFLERGGFKPKNGTEKYFLGQVPERFVLEQGDVVIAMTEQAQGLLGSSATIPKNDTYLHNQRIGLLELTDPELLDLRFVYHLMNSHDVRRQIQATATGSKVRHTAPERVESVTALVPPVAEQRTIAQILDTIDELIENDRRRVQVLEEIVGAVYREWFVKFRYPGHETVPLVDSTLGPVPEGWQIQAASTAVQIHPPIKVAKSVEHPFIGMGDVSETSMVCDPSETRSGGSGARFMNGDTLLARISPSLQNGKTGFVQSLEDGVVGLGSTEFIVLRGRNVGRVFTYCLARQEEFRSNAIASMVGASGRQRVRNDCFDTYVLAVPPPSLVESFEAAAAPMVAHVDLLHRQATSLAAAHDLLLPKLMAGQIDVSSLDLDRVLERTVV